MALTSKPLEQDGPKRERSYSSATESDKLSIWSDTGDLAEQLADEEDPLHIELEPLNDEGRALNGSSRGGGLGKKVAFEQQSGRRQFRISHPGISKEAIVIPSPPPRQISKPEKVLAFIMGPGDPQTARTRGLVGKPLLYVLPPQGLGWFWSNRCVTDILRASLSL